MGRAVSNVLVWGAAGGLLLTAILPAGPDRTESDHRLSAASTSHDAAVTSPTAPAAGGVVCASAVEHPDLMHRKHQEDNAGDRVHLRAAVSDATLADVATAGTILCGLSEPLSGPDARGRNTPLRL